MIHNKNDTPKHSQMNNKEHKTKPTIQINRPGQPTKLNKEIAEEVIFHIRQQLFISNAARLSSVPASTVINWIKRGVKDYENGLSNDFVEFALDAKKAQAEKVHEYLKIIESGVDSWRVFAWLLEKACPDDFGKNSELYKQLLNDYKMLMQSLIDQNHGIAHGKQLTITRNHTHTN